MPVLRVPVVHKFGIISHSQRIELQQRILQQTYGGSHPTSTAPAIPPRGNPLEVSEQFVQKFNVAGLKEKEILRDKAEKMLLRSKRRCGISTLGEGKHVDLPLAWSELAILAQCKGKIQEDCFDILYMSLNHAPLLEENIPTLFFLAESTLYWLRTDSMKQTYLRTSEVKLLKEKGADREAESVPALAACVYRTLCVWKCVTNTKIGLKKAIVALLMAVHEISSKDWINGFLAISLLGETAKLNMTVCKVLQDIARGLRVQVTANGIFQKHIDHFPSAAPPTAQDSIPAPGLEGKFQAEIDGLMSDIDSAMNLNTHQPKQSTSTSATNERSSRRVSRDKVSSDVDNTNALLPNNREKSISTDDQPPGVGGWCWETAYQYSQILTDICLRGSSSDIQKVALLGKWQDADVTTFRAGAANPCIESCALVDLLEYRGPPCRNSDLEQHLKGVDWTWKLRYGALSGLSQITHALYGNDAKVGMRSAAWSLISAVQDCQVTETRVLEAVRVSQVECTKVPSNERTTNVWERIAAQLSEIYLVPPEGVLLSPQTPRSVVTSPRRRRELRLTPSPRGRVKDVLKIGRPTLREELLVHTSTDKTLPDFKNRTSLDLKRVVADQWRKEMLQIQKDEDDEKVKEIVKKREEEERTEEEKLRRRNEKLKGRPTAVLGPYQVA
ncbi:transmembrane protein 232-like isoform X2 [Clavelina lepadiformis]|uniref:transmembrane protein 232-like isoform X2 n=1 Tax=Clavelina lepadiformis TaxID=159417 RepID=UPI0040431056